ncbi:MAG: ADP-ribosylation factor-like protein [Candidatus Hodarchaeales archaeon]|jgi:signal recognition particle receptor subunit beta
MEKNENPKQEYTIVLAGLASAGKTTLLNHLVQGEFGSFPATLGFDVDHFEYEGIAVRAFDLGGHEAYMESYWRELIPLADAIVFLIDASRPDYFEKSRTALDFCMRWKTGNPSLLILANKQDLSNAVPMEDFILGLGLDKLIYGLGGLHIAPSSAKTGEGIPRAFNWLQYQLSRLTPFEPIQAHAAYVFRSSGVLVSSTGSSLWKAQDAYSGDEERNDVVLMGIYSAINAIAKSFPLLGEQSSETPIRELVIQRSDGANLKLVQVAKGDMIGLVVADEHASARAIGKVAMAAIESASSNLGDDEHDIVPAEILCRDLRPLLKEPSDLKAPIEKEKIMVTSLSDIIPTQEVSIQIDDDLELNDLQFFYQLSNA